jgi:hypothetical protein
MTHASDYLDGKETERSLVKATFKDSTLRAFSDGSCAVEKRNSRQVTVITLDQAIENLHRARNHDLTCKDCRQSLDNILHRLTQIHVELLLEGVMQ